MTTNTQARVTIAQLDNNSISESFLRKGLRRLSRDYLTLTAIAILAIFTLLALLAPVITRMLGVDPTTTNPSINFLPIGSPGHLLGTDDLGRDQLARLLYAGQVSLGIGVAGASITLFIGMVIGMMTGYFGGFFDDAMNWVITTLDSIPSLYLLILIVGILSPSAGTLVFIIALIGWTGTTRLIRGQTLSLRGREYILSAQAIGASPWRIMFVHIMPNLISIVLISLASAIGGLILAESVLSFLGLGVQPPTATWGNMLTKAQTFFVRGPHLVFLPGLMIFVTVLCLYIIGDGLRDAFDPTIVD
ncbi:MAG TPA: ABC transporter permease [Oceanobacillus sp.]|nr:ABC transporter permease [Oceanobacillus sp.]